MYLFFIFIFLIYVIVFYFDLDRIVMNIKLFHHIFLKHQNAHFYNILNPKCSQICEQK